MFQVNNLSVGLINHLKCLRNAIKEYNRAICIELQEYYYEFVPDTQWQLPVRGSKNKEVGTLQQALMSLLVKVLVGMTSNFDLHFFKMHFAWLAQLVGRQSAVREVEGSSPRPDQHSGS